MRDRSPKICPLEGCYNKTWASRNLPLCGDHANLILHLMDVEVEYKAKNLAEKQLHHLKHVVRQQQRVINDLRGVTPTVVPVRATEGVVYYLRVGAYIKIGWTSDLETRMRSYSPDSVLLAVEPGTRKDENRRHKMFAAHRTHGREWYAMVPSVMHHIELIAAEHGQPDFVQFAARPVTIPTPRTPEAVRPKGGQRMTRRIG